jgi:predicted O-methyltransferase YrrM
VNLRARARASTPATKARLAAALARVRAHRNPAVRPLRRALRDSLLGAIPPEERTWGARIEARRAALAAEADASPLPTFEAGDGGFAMIESAASVGTASAIMSLPPSWCAFAMRLIRELRPQACLELGTAFGISTSYQAAALALNERGRLTTLEGSEAWAARAHETLDSLGLGDVEVTVGPIQSSLVPAVERLGVLDFVFIDAEHQEDATVGHFDVVAPAMREGAYLVLDDIDWPEMQRAFTRIADDARVAATFRLGRLGVAVMAGERRPAAGAPGG